MARENVGSYHSLFRGAVLCIGGDRVPAWLLHSVPLTFLHWYQPKMSSDIVTYLPRRGNPCLQSAALENSRTVSWLDSQDIGVPYSFFVDMVFGPFVQMCQQQLSRQLRKQPINSQELNRGENAEPNSLDLHSPLSQKEEVFLSRGRLQIQRDLSLTTTLTSSLNLTFPDCIHTHFIFSLFLWSFCFFSET